MVQQISRSSLTALRIGQVSSELSRIISTPHDTAVGFDLEGTGLNPRKDKLIMIQLKPRNKRPLFIDARDEDPEVLRQALMPLITDSKRILLGQNLLFDLSWLLGYFGFTVDQLRARFEDTMIRELVILGLGYGDARKRGLAVNMYALGERYGVPVHKEERNWFIGLDQRPDDWAAPFPETILDYARQDVSVLHPIADKQQVFIDEYGLQKVVNIEARVLPATAGMQHYGLAVNREKWLEIIGGIDAHAEELATRLHAEIDVPVMEARRQAWVEKSQPYHEWVQARDKMVAEAKEQWERPETFTGLGLRVKATKKSGWGEYKKQLLAQYEADYPKPVNPPALKDGVNLDSPAQIKVAMWSRGHEVESADKTTLAPLAAGDPVVKLYLEYKDYSTARTKYGAAYLDEHAPMGVLYSFIQQVGTETGRFAFKEPNIQQVPSKGAGEHLREAIVPRLGFVFVDADFTNVELMITAYVTRDPVMLQAFADREDLHARTAEVMFNLRANPEYLAALEAGVTPKEWTDGHKAVIHGVTLGASYRAIAKTINFGLLYGMGANRLASQLRIPVDAAKQLMRLYRETYKVAVGWLRSQGQRIEEPDQDGRVYAATIAGRRRWFTMPELKLDKNTTATEAQEALEKHNRRLAEIQRQLGNHPIQGTSADITKLAIALWQERYNSPEMRLVATIHDELLLEVVDDPHTIEVANQRLGMVMHQALTHFLKTMDAKVPVGVVSDHWEH